MKKLIYLASSLCILIACNNSNNKVAEKELIKEDNKAMQVSAELKAGGLYAFKNANGSYSVSKILVLDNDIVHLRTYKNEFQNIPAQISSDTLDFLIGHAPLAREGFLKDNPKFITLEQVKESELEGYKIYLEAMK